MKLIQKITGGDNFESTKKYHDGFEDLSVLGSLQELSMMRKSNQAVAWIDYERRTNVQHLDEESVVALKVSRMTSAEQHV